MTALCSGGGPSSPLSGVSPAIILTTTAIEAFLQPLIDPVAATVIAGVVAAALTIDTNSYCATDPPADPGLTSTDLLNALNVAVPSVSIPAQAKILQWFESRYWYQICQCNSGPQPTPPSVSDPGPVSQNPGLPGGSGSTPCWSVTVPFSVAARSGSVNQGQDLSGQAIPQFSPTASIPQGAFNNPSSLVAVKSVTGATHLNMSLIVHEPVGGSNTLQAYWLGYNSSLSLVGSATIEIIRQGTADLSSSTYTLNALPSTAVWWTTAVYNGDTVPHTGSVSYSFYCPQGVNVSQPCCPPDPSLTQLLRQVLSLEQLIYSAIPARVPSYAALTVHSGLSGGGTITLGADTIAVKVELTTLPSVYGEVSGTPNTYLEVGWLTPVTNEGATAGVRLTRTTQVFALPEATVSLDYSLPPGEVATITELLAG